MTRSVIKDKDIAKLPEPKRREFVTALLETYCASLCTIDSRLNLGQLIENMNDALNAIKGSERWCSASDALALSIKEAELCRLLMMAEGIQQCIKQYQLKVPKP